MSAWAVISVYERITGQWAADVGRITGASVQSSVAMDAV